MGRHALDLPAEPEPAVVPAGRRRAAVASLDSRSLACVAILWLAGLAAGFFAVLAAAARVSCAPTDTGLACRPGGTGLGVVFVLAVIAVVGVGSVAVGDARTWPTRLVRLAVAAVALGAVYLAAHALLLTA